MVATYEVWISDAFGTRLAVLSPEDRTISKLTYARTANGVGALIMTLPRDTLPDSAIGVDGRVEVWRKPDGGSAQLETDAVWLIQSHTRGITDQGARYRTIVAESALTLLGRRAVLWYAESAQALQTAAADNLIKAIFLDNLGDGADSSPFNSVVGVTSRDRSSYVLLQANVSAGPSVTKGFAWRNCLAVCQEVAKDAANLGTPVYFDIVKSGAYLELRTYTGQRGVDRSTGASRLVISAERGSLGGTVEQTTDWSDMASVVVAGGQGQAAARVVAGDADATLVGQSPFGRRELFTDATSLSDVASVTAEASAKLRERRALRTLKGSLISVPGAVYGRDWGWGDKVVAEFENESYVARIDQITVTLEGGQETIVASIRGES